jgi:hypothetical protein
MEPLNRWANRQIPEKRIRGTFSSGIQNCAWQQDTVRIRNGKERLGERFAASRFMMPAKKGKQSLPFLE